MKSNIFLTLATISFLFAVGSAGACDMGRISILQTIVQAFLGFVGVWFFGKLAKVTE